MAAFLSLCGGLTSVLCMTLLSRVGGLRRDYLLLSVFGALAHNTGQMFASALVMGSGLVFYYLPVLIVSGVVMGIVTGVVLKVVMPYIHKLNH